MEITQNIALINQLHDKYIISRSAHDALGASKFQLRLAEQRWALLAQISLVELKTLRATEHIIRRCLYQFNDSALAAPNDLEFALN